jgi:uncharacterized RDD family membrane protein YckC
MRHRSRAARRARRSGDLQPRVVPPAGFVRRVVAFAIDIVFVGALVGFLIGAIPWPLSGFVAAFAIVFVFVLGWTQPLGRSFGGGSMGLQVIGEDGESLGAGRALLRLLVLLAGTLCFFLGPASALLDPRRQAWHDKIAHSYVIRMKPLGETLRDLEEAIINKGTPLASRTRPLVVTPVKPLPLIVVLLVAAVPCAILYLVVAFARLLQNA